MSKILSCEVCEFCNQISNCDNSFPRIIQKYKKFANFTGLYFHILQCFATKLHQFTKFRMLFPDVLMNIPNLKVCPKEESSAGKR